MSGFIQNLLTDNVGKALKKEGTDAVAAFFGSEYLRDYTHASKTFRTNSYQYSPKFKFLFHVYFDINTQYITATQNWPKDANLGLTVRSIQLPTYSFDTQTLNQYNRARIVQTKIRYNPVNITFNDDNGNLLRRMWYTYYTYYFKDATQVDGWDTSYKPLPGGADNIKSDMNRRNIYDPDIGGNDDWGYIGETSTNQKTTTASALGQSKTPFFRAVNIYGFNQHNFVMYRLINPIIQSFGHDTYDYAQGGGIMENQMSLQYETVKYYEGSIDGRKPDDIVKGFGSRETYDRTLSPIARPGSNATILGQGGLLDAAGGIMEDIENKNWRGVVQKAGAAANTFKNPQSIVNAAKAEVLGAANDVITGRPNSPINQYFPTLGASSTNKNTSTTSGGVNTGAGAPKAVPVSTP